MKKKDTYSIKHSDIPDQNINIIKDRLSRINFDNDDYIVIVAKNSKDEIFINTSYHTEDPTFLYQIIKNLAQYYNFCLDKYKAKK